MKTQRICIFCEKWASGGIESFLYNVLRRVDLSRLEVDIVAACLSESVFTAPLEEMGISFRQLSGSQRKLGGNHRLFRALLRERRYDVLHLNAFQALSFLDLRSAREEGIPLQIAHSHNTDLRKSPTRWLKLRLHEWGREKYTGEATALWACAEGAAKFLFAPKRLAETGFRFIPNGIDTARFRFDPERRAAVRQNLGLGDELLVGNVGRLCYQKNQEFLLEAFARLLSKAPGAKLLLVGEGEDRKTLQEQAEALGIADSVIFYGVTDRVEDLLRAMDVFVMPSRFEGLPVTSLEAQAAGLPCVFSAAITRESRCTADAVYLPLEDGPEAWAEEILCRAGKSAEERHSAADEVCRAGFDITDVAKTIENAYLRMEV